MARLPLLAEKERKTDACRRGGRKGCAPMNDRHDDGFEFGPDESDAPSWRELWEMSKGYVYGSLAGITFVITVCLLLTAAGVI